MGLLLRKSLVDLRVFDIPEIDGDFSKEALLFFLVHDFLPFLKFPGGERLPILSKEIEKCLVGTAAVEKIGQTPLVGIDAYQANPSVTHSEKRGQRQ